MATSIVIPCYNEAQRLDREAFLRFAGSVEQVRMVMVDDGSSDGTAEVLAALQACLPERIDVVVLDKNCGKAEAVRRGILHALVAQPQFVGYWDADLATPLEVIPDFRNVLLRRDDIQLVIGARIPLLGHHIQRQPVRCVLGRIFARVASRVLRLPVYDTQCGAKLFRVTDQVAATFAVPFSTSWIFDVEILARLLTGRADAGSAGRAIYEFPLDRWRDVPGSKLKPRHFVRAIGEMARIYWRYFGPGATQGAAALPAGAAAQSSQSLPRPPFRRAA
ncbi:MAG: glycosyltransferase [Pirellulaceae bacterium]